jgi:hypothetical protein
LKYPDVTIALVFYKNLTQRHYRKALSSALAQLYPNYIVQVYNDSQNGSLCSGSIDSIQIPKEIHGNIVKIREYIIYNCNTKYLAFWDSDDVFIINRLVRQVECIEKYNSDVVFSNFGYVNDLDVIMPGEFLSSIKYNKRSISVLDENYLGLGISLFNTQTLRGICPFPEVSRLDWYILMKYTECGYKISTTGMDVFGYYRVHEQSLSSLKYNYSAQDIQNEIKCKLELYNALKPTDDILSRIAFFEEAILDSKYINKMLNRIPINTWGGLSEYKR